MRCSIHPSARQAGMPRLSMSNLLSSANLCSLDALSPVLDAVVVVRPSDQELVLQKDPSEANLKVRNHGEGPY